MRRTWSWQRGVLCGLGAMSVACANSPPPATCTETIRAVHTEGALGGHSRVRDVIWDRPGGYTRFVVGGFDETVRSVSLSLSRSDVAAWVAEPDAPFESEEIWDYRDLGTEWSQTGELEPEDLGPYVEAGVDELHFVVATPEPMSWAACVRLDTSPFLQLDAGAAIPVGGALALDHDVWGDEAPVSIRAEGELPGWASWDTATGEVTGIATEAGIWEFTVVAEGLGGRRELPSGIASYDPSPLGCGASTAFETDRGTEETDWAIGGDPRSFGAFVTSLPPTASSVSLRATGLDSAHAAFAAFLGPELGSTDPLRVSDPVDANEVEVALDPARWPSLRDVRSVSHQLWSRVGNRYRGVENGSVQLVCDEAPRLDLLAVPVLPVGVSATWDLPSVGGREPIDWSSPDLPEGVSLDATGRLAWSGSGDWVQHTTDLVLTDADGVATVESVTLFQGDDAAVEGRLLRCGDTLTGSVENSREVELFVETAAWRSGHVVLRAAISEFGGRLRVADPNGEWTLPHEIVHVDDGGRITLDERSAVPLSAYAERPLPVQLWSYGPGDYELALECGG